MATPDSRSSCAALRRLEAALSLVFPVHLARLAAVLLSILAGHGAWAQPGAALPPAKASMAGSNATSEGPAWGQLTAHQRQALAPLERDWESIDASRKAKWVEVAQRFSSMPSEERQRVQARMAEWARLTPAERGRARLNFQESKQLSREHKQERWEAYKALPDERRRELASRAKPRDERASAPASGATAAAPLRKPAASGAQLKPVAPTIVQAKPGATTTLMTRQVAPPPHQHPGQPIIAAKPSQVDRRTLLPKSGPQAAASAPVHQ